MIFCHIETLHDCSFAKSIALEGNKKQDISKPPKFKISNNQEP